jgi:glycosyltransferase involved in cell wall biosynthesis
MKRFDVTVMPSTVEGFGLTVVESMACGVPVAAFNAPAVNEIITNRETGVLAEPAEKSSLMAAVAQLLNDRELHAAVVGRGRKLAAARYSVERMVDEYDRFLLQL